MVVGLNSHLRVTALGARGRSRKNTIFDRPPNGFVRSLLFRIRLATLTHPISVDFLLLLVVLPLGGTLTIAALRLQSVYLSGVLAEFGPQQYLLASGAAFQEIAELHLIIFHRGQGIGNQGRHRCFR